MHFCDFSQIFATIQFWVLKEIEWDLLTRGGLKVSSRHLPTNLEMYLSVYVMPEKLSIRINKIDIIHEMTKFVN